MFISYFFICFLCFSTSLLNFFSLFSYSNFINDLYIKLFIWTTFCDKYEFELFYWSTFNYYAQFTDILFFDVMIFFFFDFDFTFLFDILLEIYWIFFFGVFLFKDSSQQVIELFGFLRLEENFDFFLLSYLFSLQFKKNESFINYRS